MPAGTPNKPSRAPKLSPGDRVRFTAIGRERNPRLAKLNGTITGITPTSSGYRVLIDGNKRPVLLHETYIEKLPDACG